MLPSPVAKRRSLSLEIALEIRQISAKCQIRNWDWKASKAEPVEGFYPLNTRKGSPSRIKFL